MNHELLNGVQVYRTCSLLSKHKDKIINITKKLNDQPVITEDQKSIKVKSLQNITNPVIYLLINAYRTIWRKIYWPDYACFWYFSAKKKLNKLMKENNYDVLISVSPPFTGHLISLRVLKNKPNVKWLVDSGDPFSYLQHISSNNTKIYGNLNYFIEKLILKKCDYLSFTTNGTLDLYAKYFESLKIRDKSKAIPPILSNEKITIEKQYHLPRTHHNIVFVGTLYNQIRSPEYLLALINWLFQNDFKEIKQFMFHFYGNNNGCLPIFLKYKDIMPIMKLYGVVSRSIASSATNHADVLLNIGNLNTYQLPSKIVEYIKTGKPIVNSCYAENDSSALFLKEYPIFYNIVKNDSLETQATGLLNFLKSYVGKHVDSEVINKYLEKNTITAVATQYEKLLELS